MMIAKVMTPALIGLSGEAVEIECDVANGLPGITIVGLGDKAVEEARERIRSAIRNSGLVMPPKRLTLNLAPADLPKDGTGYDLGLAIAVLIASEQLPAAASAGCCFYGELALEGSLRPVRGALIAAEVAIANGATELFIASKDALTASNLDGIKIYPVPDLRSLYRHLTGEKLLDVVKRSAKTVQKRSKPHIDMADIYGQDQAKRALEIAAAGGHHLLMSGPPGAGKTLLAHALIDLLPDMTQMERIEILKLQNLAGEPPIQSERPFRAPHHTASSVALTGGGTHPRPGEISLSHRGVLLLDEAPEFSRGVLEVLRQPLEDGVVTVARATRSVTYPARFLLVMTRNPCPCGYATDPLKKCSCTPAAITRYSQKLSGPLLDRIDLSLEVGRLETDRLVNQTEAESTATIRRRVEAARKLQRQRQGEERTNAHISTTELAEHCKLDSETQTLARQAIDHLGLSARSYHRALKVARTIADLAASDTIHTHHFSEALQYRSRSAS